MKAGRTGGRAATPSDAGARPPRDPGAIDTPERVDETCVVVAFDPTWNPRAVPYDRVETNAGTVVVYLPPGSDVKVHAYRSDGSLVFQRLLKTPP